MSRSWKHNINRTAINIGNTWTWWGGGVGVGGQRWAVACRQTEVTEVSPRVLAVAQLSQTCASTEGLWEMSSAARRRSVDDALDVDNIWECTKRENIKGICSKVFGISRSYLLLWCTPDWDSQGVRNHQQASECTLHIWNFRIIKATELSRQRGFQALWSPDSCRILPQFLLDQDSSSSQHLKVLPVTHGGRGGGVKQIHQVNVSNGIRAGLMGPEGEPHRRPVPPVSVSLHSPHCIDTV